MIHYYYDLAGTEPCGKREALRWGFGRLGTGGQSNAVLTVAIQQCGGPKWHGGAWAAGVPPGGGGHAQPGRGSQLALQPCKSGIQS